MPAFDYSLVADIYDTYVNTDLDVSFFREEAKSADGRVLELMCGTGRVSMHLAAAGIPLTCVDSSPNMLSSFHKKLRQSGLSVEIMEQDITRLSLPATYALACIPFNSFSEITEDAQQLGALTAIKHCLTAHGKLIVTLHNPAIRLKRVDGCSHTIGRFSFDNRGTILQVSACEHYDAAAGMVSGQQVFEAIDAAGASLWKRIVEIKFRLFSRQQFHTLAEQAGFRLDSLMGNYDRSPFSEVNSPYMIWSLTK